MYKRFIYALFIAAAPLAVIASGITGKVFFDADGNGKPGANEPGIAGVFVSDGVSIVKTDASGKFTIVPAKKARHIYISTPEGFRANGKFYRTTAEKADFPLVKWQKRPRRFVQISDGEGAMRPWVKVLEKELKRNPADFLIYTGDIAANTNHGMIFASKYFTFDRMKLPVYFTIGNHDFTKGKSGDDAYMTLHGPMWYSFDSNGIHFVVAPMIWDGTGQRKDKPVTYKPADFARWIRKDLELQPSGKPIIFFAHAPVFNDPVVRTIVKPEQFNIKAFIHGHYHFCAAYELAGVPHFSASSVKDGLPFAAMGIYEFDASGNPVRLPGLITANFSKPEKKPEIQWRHTLAKGNYILADPVLWKNVIFTGVSDALNRKNCGIAAIDRSTGKELWFFATHNSVQGPMTLKDDVLYAADTTGFLYAINCADGKLRRKIRFGDSDFAGYLQGVITYKDKVIVGYWNSLKAFSISDGKLLWHTRNKRGKLANFGEGGANILAGNIIINGDGGRRSAVNADTGKLLWQSGVYNVATPLYADGRLYVLHLRDIWEINLKNGRPVRQFVDSSKHWSGRFTPQVHKGTLFSGSSLYGLAAVDLASGKLKWRFLPGKDRSSRGDYPYNAVLGRLLIYRDKILAGAQDGKVYALNIADGKPAWSFDTGVPVSGITLDKDDLFVTVYDGSLYKISLKNIK